MAASFWASYVALWVVVAVLAVVIVGLIRTVFTLTNPERSKSLQGGAMAPAFEATSLDGRVITSASLAGKLTALLFASPNCATCMTTMDELNALSQKAHGNVVVVCWAGNADCALLQSRHQLTQTVLVDADGALASLFEISGTPTAVIIDEMGRILSVGNPKRASDLEELMELEPNYTPQAQAAGAR